MCNGPDEVYAMLIKSGIVIFIKGIEMKKITLNTSLRTVVFTALVFTLVGISACSSEKENTNAQSSEAMAVDQDEENASEGTAPMVTSDDNLAAEAEYRATTADTDMSESTDSVTNDSSDNDIAENPNADQTAADGLQ